MSHFTGVETQIKDLEAFKKACRELALPLQVGGVARGWAGNTLAADYVIKMPCKYDVAVHVQPDGTLKLTTDWYDGSVARIVGKSFQKLSQLYAVNKTEALWKAKGYTVHRRTDKGAIKLKIEGNNL